MLGISSHETIVLIKSILWRKTFCPGLDYYVLSPLPSSLDFQSCRTRLLVILHSVFFHHHRKLIALLDTKCVIHFPS